jgi:hypothetical protein
MKVMKKQYRISESYQLKRIVEAYHNGELVLSQRLWMDEADKYADQLEKDGYIYGYTKEEVEEEKERYERMLNNIIQ